MKYCTIDDCEKPVRAKGWCTVHYYRWYQYGTMETKRSKLSAPRPKEWNIWYHMIRRCANPTSRYFKHYRGRGITVCDRWMTYENFYEDMGPRPTPKHSLDRIDNDGNYELSNCRWASPHQQAVNKSNSAKHPGIREFKYKTRSRWRVSLTVNRKAVFDGMFDSLEEALEARKKAERKWNIEI